MENIIPVIAFLLFTTVIGFYFAYKYYIANKINYNNYRNAIRALAECDPELRNYLEKNPERSTPVLEVIEKIFKI